MNESPLQRIIDEIQATSMQQWWFRLIAVAATVGALLAAAAANDRLWPAGLIIVPALALASAIRPDTPTAMIVVVIVVLHWLDAVDDVGTPWLPVAAVCLLAYHAVIALTASIPIGGVVPMATIAQWGGKVGLAAATTAGMWVFVAILDGRDAPGNALLTALALALVATATLVIRSRSLGTQRPRS